MLSLVRYNRGFLTYVSFLLGDRERVGVGVFLAVDMGVWTGMFLQRESRGKGMSGRDGFCFVGVFCQ